MKLLKSFLTNFSITINFIVLTIIAEWIQIPQISVPLNGPQDTLMLSDIPGIHTESNKPIRYEDLEHIVGPGFEDELEIFYKKHKNDFKTLSSSHSHTTNLPDNEEETTSYDQYNETIFNEDPWSYYDQIPKATVATTTTTTTISMENESTVVAKNPTRKFIAKPIVPTHLETTTTKSTNTNNNSMRKKIVKIIKVKQKPTEPKATSLSFSGFLKFLKDIQSSFVFGASRSLKDKMIMLENFRDTLLINIGKSFSFNLYLNYV